MGITGGKAPEVVSHAFLVEDCLWKVQPKVVFVPPSSGDHSQPTVLTLRESTDLRPWGFPPPACPVCGRTDRPPIYFTRMKDEKKSSLKRLTRIRFRCTDHGKGQWVQRPVGVTPAEFHDGFVWHADDVATPRWWKDPEAMDLAP